MTLDLKAQTLQGLAVPGDAKVGIMAAKLAVQRRPLFHHREVAEYLNATFPSAMAKAKAMDARVLFVDESAIRSDAHRGTTWGSVGETPVVRDSGRRFGMNLISAVSPRGDLRFSVTGENMDLARFIAFLKQLHRDAGGPIRVVVDNAKSGDQPAPGVGPSQPLENQPETVENLRRKRPYWPPFHPENAAPRRGPMPRASRHFLPGHVLHITHRCHEREFLLRFARDRRFWRSRLYEARRRHALCMLNYIVTRNHIHLLVRDRGRGKIARSMQLIAGRTGQAFNRRKQRKGASGKTATMRRRREYLARCLVYIKLSMVRAGVVRHTLDWELGGYREIQSPPSRYQVIDLEALTDALGLRDVEQLWDCHLRWVEDGLASGVSARDERWTSSLAVGSEAFVHRIQQEMGLEARSHAIESDGATAHRREPSVAYEAVFEPENGLQGASRHEKRGVTRVKSGGWLGPTPGVQAKHAKQ